MSLALAEAKAQGFELKPFSRGFRPDRTGRPGAGPGPRPGVAAAGGAVPSVCSGHWSAGCPRLPLAVSES